MRKLLLLFAAAAAAVFFLSCGNNPPEINQLNSQINLRRNPLTGQIRAELLVLLNADDEDGDEDLETIFVIDDEHEILWTIGQDIWSVRNNRGMTWIGSERLMMPFGELPSPGKYRIIVADRAGERVEGTVFVPLVKEQPEAAFYPELIFGDEDKIEIKSIEKNNIVSFYDPGGNLLGAFSVTPGILSLKSINDGGKIFSEYRYADIGYYDNRSGTGLISGSYERRTE